MNTMQDVVMRYLKNPILTREDVPYPVATVHKRRGSQIQEPLYHAV